MRAERRSQQADKALREALENIRALDLPHLEIEEPEDQVIH
jgi:hypothetical protein